MTTVTIGVHQVADLKAAQEYLKERYLDILNTKHHDYAMNFEYGDTRIFAPVTEVYRELGNDNEFCFVVGGVDYKMSVASDEDGFYVIISRKAHCT